MLDRLFKSPWMDQEVLWGAILTALMIVSWAYGVGLVFGGFYTLFVYFNLSTFGDRRLSEMMGQGEKDFNRHFERIDIRLISKIFFLTALPFIIFVNVMSIVPTSPYADMIAQNNQAFVEYVIQSLPFNEPAFENFQSKVSSNSAAIYISMLGYTISMSIWLLLASILGAFKTMWRSFKYREAKYYNFHNKNFRLCTVMLPGGVLLIYAMYVGYVVDMTYSNHYLMRGNHTVPLYVHKIFWNMSLMALLSFMVTICFVMPVIAIIFSYQKRHKL